MARSTSRSWAVGGTIFAACLMIMVGVWQVLIGIAAIAEDTIFVSTPDYIYQLDLTGWGWIHLIIGGLAVITGLFLFGAQEWARWVGIALAIVSAIGQFFWMPYQPLWSMAVIAVDVFVIWALATVGEGMGGGFDERRTETGEWSSMNAQEQPMTTNPSRAMDDAQQTSSDAAAKAEHRMPPGAAPQ
ncbi:hypothetical protein GCM10029992_26700 [Glycomyces albus]